MAARRAAADPRGMMTVGRRLLRRRAASSAAWVFGLIFVAEVTILIYMKATLVPTPTSAMTAFTSSSPDPQRPVAAAAAAAEPIQARPDAQEQERPQLVAPLTIASVAMGRPASEQESVGSGAQAAALLAQALLEQLAPEQEEEGENAPQSRAYVVSAEDVIEERESVAAADMLLVVHEAPYDLACGAAADASASASAAVAGCRQRAQQAGALQSALALEHDGDMVLHVDGSALRGLAGAVMVAEELLQRWGVGASGVDVKAAVEATLLTSSAAAAPAGAGAEDSGARRRCVDAVDGDVVCRAWHDFYYELFTALTPPLVDDDDVSAWLPGALEAASATAPALAAASAADAAALEPMEGAGQKEEVSPKSDKEAEEARPAPAVAAAAAAAEEPITAAAADAAAKPRRQGKWATTDIGVADDDALPELFYCLPGGGLNDITVEWWHCIEWAVETGRTLVMGFENYLAPAPPYTPYFELQALSGLTTMSPAEAARRIRKARRRGSKVTVFPRRLQRDPDPILVPACESEEERAAILAGERPWKFDWDNLHHLGFEFEKEYGQQVVVFHRKGNVGSGQKTLQSLLLSDEIKRTFLERWRRLHKPYIGLHIRSTDKSCADAVMQRTLRRTRRLKRAAELEDARQVYLATDSPGGPPANFKKVIEEKQGREIVSFTFHPKPKNMTGVAVSQDPTSRREALESNSFIRQKRIEFKAKGIMPLHLADYLSPEEKHQTNVDAFVDLLLLASSARLITSCGGYGKLAQGLHDNKPTILSLIGELPPGHDVNDNDLDVNAVLEAAAARLLGQAAAAAEQ